MVHSQDIPPFLQLFFFQLKDPPHFFSVFFFFFLLTVPFILVFPAKSYLLLSSPDVPWHNSDVFMSNTVWACSPTMFFPHLSFLLLLYHPIPYYSSEHPSSWSITAVIPASTSTPCCWSIHQREQLPLSISCHSLHSQSPPCVPDKCVFCMWRLQFLGRLSSLGVQCCYRAAQAQLTDLSYGWQTINLSVLF